MKYIEAPNYSVATDRLDSNNCLFLAGSISNAKDWQKTILQFKLDIDNGDQVRGGLLDHFNCFNPRRKDFVFEPTIEQEQIEWEYHCIHKCKHILFWFSEETLAPITLFELGSALNTHKHSRIYIGCDPEYKRRNDVITQTGLRNTTIRIASSLRELAENAILGKIFQNVYQ